MYVEPSDRRFENGSQTRSCRSTRRRPNFDIDGDEVHYPTRPVDKDKAENELVINIKKATSPEESAPKQKHVRSTCLIFYSQSAVSLISSKNVSSTLGITIAQYLSGVVYVCNLSCPTKSKLSRLSLLYIKYYKKATLWCVTYSPMAAGI